MAALPVGAGPGWGRGYRWPGHAPRRGAARTWPPCRCARSGRALRPWGRAGAGLGLRYPARASPCCTARFEAPRRHRPRGARAQQGGVKRRLLPVRPVRAKFKFSPPPWTQRGASGCLGAGSAAQHLLPLPANIPRSRGWPRGGGRTGPGAPRPPHLRTGRLGH